MKTITIIKIQVIADKDKVILERKEGKISAVKNKMLKNGENELNKFILLCRLIY